MKLATSHAFAAVIGLAALAAVGLFVWRKGGVRGAASSAGGAVVDAAIGATEGVVYGVGDAVGVPRTNETECERAKREGRTWDASFACAAGDFIGHVFGASVPLADAEAQRETQSLLNRYPSSTPPPRSRESYAPDGWNFENTFTLGVAP